MGEEEGDEREGEGDAAGAGGPVDEAEGEACGGAEEAERADEVDEAPLGEVAPGEAEAEDAEQGAALHAPEEDRHARREEREHDADGRLGGGEGGQHEHERRADGVEREVGRGERLEAELLAEVEVGVEVVAEHRGARAVEGEVGDGGVTAGGEGRDDGVGADRHDGERERGVERGAADSGVEPVEAVEAREQGGRNLPP